MGGGLGVGVIGQRTWKDNIKASILRPLERVRDSTKLSNPSLNEVKRNIKSDENNTSGR
jgi:hypothetical protein